MNSHVSFFNYFDVCARCNGNPISANLNIHCRQKCRRKLVLIFEMNFSLYFNTWPHPHDRQRIEWIVVVIKTYDAYRCAPITSAGLFNQFKRLTACRRRRLSWGTVAAMPFPLVPRCVIEAFNENRMLQNSVQGSSKILTCSHTGRRDRNLINRLTLSTILEVSRSNL